jgi:hypothetical protein
MSVKDLEKDDVVIFRMDEHNDGHVSEYDGHVQFLSDSGVHVLYLSGHHSRNDLVPWADIIAKVDLSKPRIKLKTAPYNGHFVVFNDTLPSELV